MAEYGKCKHDLIGDFWQPDDSVGPHGSTAYTFEDADDHDPIWFGGVWEVGDPDSPEGSTWSAEVHRHWMPAAWDELRADGFADMEAAIEWCESWQFCPECGQG